MCEHLYSYTKPVADSRMFYGRQGQRDQILRGIEMGNSYSIVGGRRMGKTSLLRELERSLLAQLPGGGPRLLVPVYIDLNYLNPETRRMFLVEIVERLTANLSQHLDLSLQADAPLVSRSTAPDHRAFDEFCGDLEAIFRATRRIGRLRAVLLIDEIDILTGKTWTLDLFGKLRALLSNHPLSNNVVLVSTGVRYLYEVATERSSPLANVLTLQVLSVFERGELDRLVNEPTQGALPPTAVETIYQQTGGHPFLAQYFMSKLCQQENLAAVDEPTVIQVGRTLLRERHDFEMWYDHLSQLDRDVYSFLVSQERPAEKQEVREAFAASDDVVGSLETLAYTGVIVEGPDNVFQPCGDLFKDWFVENKMAGKAPPPSSPGRTCTLSIFYSPGQKVDADLKNAITLSVESRNILNIDIDTYDRLARNAYEAADWRFHVKNTGTNLYATSFEEHLEVIRAYERAMGRVDWERGLRLCFKASRDFLRVPIEFLFDGWEYLILRHPLYRFVIGAHTAKEQVSNSFLEALSDRGEKLKVLLIASNTPPSINGVDEEVASLNTLLPTILGPSDLDLTYIPTEEASYQRVREELRQCPYHMLHYAGHGDYDRQSAERTGLPLWTQEGRQGSTQDLTAAQMASLLRDSELRFAYFSSCYGTRAGPRAQLSDDDFLGMADAVIAAGVPAVLGFRWPVSDEGAMELASHFYTRFFEHGSLDLALLEARLHITEDTIGRDDDTWASPILIMQT